MAQQHEEYMEVALVCRPSGRLCMLVQTMGDPEAWEQVLDDRHHLTVDWHGGQGPPSEQDPEGMQSLVFYASDDAAEEIGAGTRILGQSCLLAADARSIWTLLSLQARADVFVLNPKEMGSDVAGYYSARIGDAPGTRGLLEALHAACDRLAGGESIGEEWGLAAEGAAKER